MVNAMMSALDNRKSAKIYDIKIDENETAKRCCLSGKHTIRISTTGIELLDSKQNVVYNWPYNYIRKYGVDNNNRNVFVIEAGRSCDSGEGQFRFQTHKAQKIHDLIYEHLTKMYKLSHPEAKSTSLTQDIAKQPSKSGNSVVYSDANKTVQARKNYGGAEKFHEDYRTKKSAREEQHVLENRPLPPKPYKEEECYEEEDHYIEVDIGAEDVYEVVVPKNPKD